MSINEAQRRHSGLKRVALGVGLSVLALAHATSASAAAIPPGDIVVIAGTGTAGCTTTTLATTTQLFYPNGVAVDSSGNVYIADTFHHIVRKVTPAGLIANIAGTGTSGSTTTSIATTTQLSYPIGLAVDAGGDVYIADTQNSVIRRVTPAGGIATIAETGTAGSTTTTTATTTQLFAPRGVAVDAGGNVYIADTNNHVVRKVTPAGAIATIAGTGVHGSTTTTTAITTQLYPPGG